MCGVALESTQDILGLGGMPGAMGAFEPDDKEDSGLAAQYGINRNDYASRDEYVEALNNARFHASCGEADKDEDESGLWVIGRVSRLDNGENRNYRSDDVRLQVGDQVIVPNENGASAVGIVVAVRTPAAKEPGIAAKLPKIIGKA